VSAGAVAICEVGPRDGLQNEDVTLAPAVRAELVTRLAGTGLERVEAVSFVNPERVPQMAGAEDVLAALAPDAFERCSGLVLNGRGFERALAAGVREVHYSFGATDAFNRRNANATVDEGLAGALEVITAAREAGLRVTVTVSVAFGCPYEGTVEPVRVLDLVERVAEREPDEVVLADTIGVATPGRVLALVREAMHIFARIGGHFHDTRGTGIANAWAALEAGAVSLDASVGGIGGCPFAPKATGNIATEDLVYLLDREGIETGIDLPSLLGVGEWVEGLLGHPLPGRVYRAGMPLV
jgi:hydroxymethylglutaryl-CoA lyase/(R)-citramalyl-CoA lyase